MQRQRNGSGGVIVYAGQVYILVLHGVKNCHGCLQCKLLETNVIQTAEIHQSGCYCNADIWLISCQDKRQTNKCQPPDTRVALIAMAEVINNK